MKHTSYIKKNDFEKFYKLPFVNHFEEGYKAQGYQWYRWAGTDSYNAFQTNKHKLQHWVDNPFDYRVDRQQFRTHIDLNNHNGDVSVALGCSNTFGLGMPEELIWPTLMSDHINHPVVNLGIAGSGPDHHYLALHNVIDKLNVKSVFHFHQVFGRRLMVKFDDEGNKRLAPLSFQDNNDVVYDDKYWMNVMLDEGMIDFEHKRAIDSIAGMCYSRGIKYYNFNTQPYLNYFVRDNYDIDKTNTSSIKQASNMLQGDIPSRDLIHPSKMQHQAIAQRFIDHLDLDSYIEPFYDIDKFTNKRKTAV
jgi:hypothetical protein